MKTPGNSGESAINTAPSRRKFIALAGAAGTVALAGCGGDGDDGGGGGDGDSDGGDGDSDGGGDGGSTDGDMGSVTVASLNPINGAYSSLGPGQRAGAELAVQQINNNDEYDFEFDPVYGDTETETGAAQSEAQRVVQEDGADFVFGAISSSVALSLNEFANQAEFIYFPGGAAVPITGSACNEWVFRFETNTAQIAEAISAYTVNNLGTNVWFHYADYAYGESVYDRVSQRMESASDDYTEVSTSTSALGSSNFGSFISEISNSDADVVVLGMTGGDLINFTAQAADRGLKDDVAVVGPTQSFQVVRGATGQSSVGTFGGVRYLPKLETGDNQQFVEAFQSENESPPDNFARVGYDSFRLIAKGIDAAGSTDPGDVRDALEGGDFTTVLGDITLREGDHQATNPTWVGELVAGEGEMADVELLQQVEGEDTLPPADELGCEMG